MPSIKLTLILIMLALVFARLGFWQLERKAEKGRLFEQFEQAPSSGIEQALVRAERFTRVEAWGRYERDRHVLLDNRILNGRVGVHVLTPFVLPDGRQILVNRGWLPMAADRLSLPKVITDDSPRTIRGILNLPPTTGPRHGAADVLRRDRWPQLVTWLDMESVSEALDAPLEPWVLQLDGRDESGFEGRDWQPAVMGPEVHGAYALQWFALAAATLIIWVTLGFRPTRPDAAGIARTPK